MKKLTCSLAFILITGIALGQQSKAVKNLPKKDTAKYQRFYKVPEGDYYQLLNFAHSYKDDLIYNQLMQANDKVQLQLNISGYLFNLRRIVQIDSVKMKKDTIRK